MLVTLVTSQGCLSNAASFTEASLSSSKLERTPHASESWEPMIWWLLPVSAFSESPLQSKSLPRYLRSPSCSLVPAPLPHCSPSGFRLGWAVSPACSLASVGPWGALTVGGREVGVIGPLVLSLGGHLKVIIIFHTLSWKKPVQQTRNTRKSLQRNKGHRW